MKTQPHSPHPLATFAIVAASSILFCSKGVVAKLAGAMRFTGIAGGFSCVFMLAHAAAARPVAALLDLPAAVYGEGAILAIFGTVAPTLLLSLGLGRTTPQQFAIIGTVGPVATLLLAWAVLGERPNLGQVLGFALTMGGGLAVSLLKGGSAAPAPATPTSGENPAR